MCACREKGTIEEANVRDCMHSNERGREIASDQSCAHFSVFLYHGIEHGSHTSVTRHKRQPGRTNEPEKNLLKEMGRSACEYHMANKAARWMTPVLDFLDVCQGLYHSSTPVLHFQGGKYAQNGPKWP